jgi:hypothetical protein
VLVVCLLLSGKSYYERLTEMSGGGDDQSSEDCLSLPANFNSGTEPTGRKATLGASRPPPSKSSMRRGEGSAGMQ